MSCLSEDIRIPRGVSDKLPGVAIRIKSVESTVLNVTRLWGYQFIQPAPLEFEDVLALGMGQELTGKAFRFDDWESARLLAVPPDITPQMARISAKRLQNLAYPHRLSYSGMVLRHAESQSGRQREVYQAGAELIGKSGPGADAEVLAMAASVATECKLDMFTINISHVGVCQGVLDLFPGSADDLTKLKRAISLKDTSAVLLMCDHTGCSPELKEQLVCLTRLFGGAEVFEHARKISWNTTTATAIKELQSVVALLSEQGVDILKTCTFDLGETRGLGYHTGISFECFSPFGGESMISGGRYDTLMERYGVHMPATGFTCDVTALARALDRQNGVQIPTIDLLIITEAKELVEISHNLRLKGITVVAEHESWSYDKALDYAQHHNIKFLLMGDTSRCSLVRCCDSKRQLLNSLVDIDAIVQFIVND